MSKEVESRRQGPGARFAVVDGDPYGESIAFWQDPEDAFEAWTERCGYNWPNPILLELREDATYGPVSDEDLATRIEDHTREEVGP